MHILILLVVLPLHLMAANLDLGIGYIGLNTHHYKGSDETKTFNLYVPYVNYQGDYLEADNAVINSKFFKSRFLSFKLSLGAAPNVENDNEARRDMPELLYNFGIGPMLVLHIFKFPRFILNIEANYRQEFETDLDYTASFGITQTIYLSTKILGDTWSFELSYGITNADRDYHAYYYTVDSEFATNEREEYRAKSGFSSRVTILTMKKRFGDFLLFPFVRYENLEGSVIEDSPLVKQTDYYFYGLGLFYLFI